jgi:hypothetical protein
LTLFWNFETQNVEEIGRFENVVRVASWPAEGKWCGGRRKRVEHIAREPAGKDPFLEVGAEKLSTPRQAVIEDITASDQCSSTSELCFATSNQESL